MIKKKIEYKDFYNGEVHDLDDTIYLNHTIKTLRLYEQKHGTYFYDDYQTALEEFRKIDLEKISKGNDEDVELDTSMLSFMASPAIMRFVEKALPCMYAEVQSNALVQTEETMHNMQEAVYFAELMSLETFMEIMALVTKNQGKAPKKKKPGK